MTETHVSIRGLLSGELHQIPNVGVDILREGAIVNGVLDERFIPTDPPAQGFPDVRSFRRRFGLLLPATNTVMEHELWSLIADNEELGGLDGIGIKTTPVITPRPNIATLEGIAEYKTGFIGGLGSAVQTALLASPQFLIMGMSLEHILFGLEPIHQTMESVKATSNLSWSTWHDAVQVALRLLNAKRIGLLTPFEASGNASATRMFNDMGFEVAASVGLTVSDLRSIAHIPDAAKERAILDVLADSNYGVDAIVQCGTNMSMINVIDRLEGKTGIPIVAINPTLLWFALRENGFDRPILGAGKLLREF